jgi:hypothetical protein
MILNLKFVVVYHWKGVFENVDTDIDIENQCVINRETIKLTWMYMHRCSS